MRSVFLALTLAVCAHAKLNFLAMGDWGGQPNSPYSTGAERATASRMSQVANTFNISFGTGIGDNFYDDGVKNEYDRRFKETFEDVFYEKDLFFPWYMVAGNHDHHQNVSGEIYYSNHSTRWVFPDYYYTKTVAIPGTTRTLQLVWIDTVVLAGDTMDASWCKEHPGEECILHPQGPKDLKLAADQWSWIEATLASSRADYLIVLGHYPVWSIAEHGPTSLLVSKLRPMLEKYKVTAYFCGHDHTMEYLQESGSDIGYVVTGAAHLCDPSTAHRNSVPKGSLKYHGCSNGGFVKVELDDAGMTVDYYVSAENSVKYTVAFKPRK